MKYLKTYKLFEQNSFDIGSKVMIMFKLPGTDNRELVTVKIVKNISNSNRVLVSFQVEGNPFYNHSEIEVKTSKIIGPYHDIQEPLNPDYTNTQPVGTDYNSPGKIGSGGSFVDMSNDVVLPNS